jgi:hypothetical protein
VMEMTGFSSCLWRLPASRSSNLWLPENLGCLPLHSSTCLFLSARLHPHRFALLSVPRCKISDRNSVPPAKSFVIALLAASRLYCVTAAIIDLPHACDYPEIRLRSNLTLPERRANSEAMPRQSKN